MTALCPSSLGGPELFGNFRVRISLLKKGLFAPGVYTLLPLDYRVISSLRHTLSSRPLRSIKRWDSRSRKLMGSSTSGRASHGKSEASTTRKPSLGSVRNQRGTPFGVAFFGLS
jgi:hypothetical protein